MEKYLISWDDKNEEFRLLENHEVIFRGEYVQCLVIIGAIHLGSDIKNAIDTATRLVRFVKVK